MRHGSNRYRRLKPVCGARHPKIGVTCSLDPVHRFAVHQALGSPDEQGKRKMVKEWIGEGR